MRRGTSSFAEGRMLASAARVRFTNEECESSERKVEEGKEHHRGSTNVPQTIGEPNKHSGEALERAAKRGERSS